MAHPTTERKETKRVTNRHREIRETEILWGLEIRLDIIPQ